LTGILKLINQPVAQGDRTTLWSCQNVL